MLKKTECLPIQNLKWECLKSGTVFGNGRPFKNDEKCFLFNLKTLLCFVRNMSRNVGKNITKSVSSKYNLKLLDHAKQSAADAIKTASKRVIQKIAEATGVLIGNNIADKIARVSKTSPKDNSETNEEEILRKRFIPP